MTRITVGALLAGVLAHAVPAQEWNQWRGPAREGVVAASSAPKVWPAKLERAWRVDVGEGYSSPVISGGRVFVHSRRDPEELVMAVDLATGAQTLLSEWPTGSGPLGSLSGIERSGGRVWVTSPSLGAVLAVDLRFGQRTILAR